MGPRDRVDKNKQDVIASPQEDYAASISRLGAQKLHVLTDFVPRIIVEFSQDASVPRNERLLVLLDLMHKLSNCITDTYTTLPHSAPKLWKNRNSEFDNDPFKFIEENYGEYLNDMDQSDLRRLDFPLYRAFQHWKHRFGPPKSFSLITKKQRTDKLLSEIAGDVVNIENMLRILPDIRPDNKLYETVRSRVRKGR